MPDIIIFMVRYDGCGHLHVAPWLTMETDLDLCLEVVESDLEQEFEPQVPEPELVADTTVTTQPTQGETGNQSILDKLRSPTKSDLARKRKVEKPKAPTAQTKKRKSTVVNQSDPKTVSPVQRVRDFPNECLEVRNDKLFCVACREVISLKKSTVKNHISLGDKHKNAKEKLARKEARERNIVESLHAYDKRVGPAGVNVSMEQRVYRVKVVEQFLKAGIPLVKVDSLRSLLEEGALRLTHSSHLSDYIPLIHGEEKKLIRSEIDGQRVSVIFDGTTRLGEALAIVIRFCSGWKIQQRLVRMSLLSKSLTGEEVAREVLTVLSTELGIPPSDVVAAMRDRASVNSVAMRTVAIMYPQVMDIGCMAHTLDLVGRHFELPTLTKFMKHWEVLFKHSPKARLLWRERTGSSVASYSPTRWWSKWECEKQVLALWGDVLPFLSENTDVAPKSREKLLNLIRTQSCKLLIELAVDVDAGEPFVKATYNLEGDGPLALECYDILNKVKAAVKVRHWPNTAAIAKKIGNQQLTEQHWMKYALNCVMPGLDYFTAKFDGELGLIVTAFQSARLFNPTKVIELIPDAAAVDNLRSFKFLNSDEVIGNLKSELPAYLAAADGTSSTVDLLVWWERHSETLLHWASACKTVLLCQPSSAAVERVFSLLNSQFNHSQFSALEDYLEAAIMLQYNKRQ